MLTTKLIKTVASYCLILAAGLGTGYAASQVPNLLKKPYSEADHSEYYAGTGNKVILYGTDWCGYCAKTRAYLTAKKIPFSDMDIEKSATAKQQFAKLNGGPVPLLLVGDRRITGFNPDTLDSALKALDDK